MNNEQFYRQGQYAYYHNRAAQQWPMWEVDTFNGRRVRTLDRQAGTILGVWVNVELRQADVMVLLDGLGVHQYGYNFLEWEYPPAPAEAQWLLSQARLLHVLLRRGGGEDDGEPRRRGARSSVFDV